MINMLPWILKAKSFRFCHDLFSTIPLIQVGWILLSFKGPVTGQDQWRGILLEPGCWRRWPGRECRCRYHLNSRICANKARAALATANQIRIGVWDRTAFPRIICKDQGRISETWTTRYQASDTKPSGYMQRLR